MTTIDILQRVVFPLCRGSYLFSERPSLEGVHSFLCAKEIYELIKSNRIFLDTVHRQEFITHKEGKKIVVDWAVNSKLDYQMEVDISVGVVDVIIYADDTGLFEIGTTRPTKIILLLHYISKMNGFYTVHFWPYSSKESFVFRNWTI